MKKIMVRFLACFIPGSDTRQAFRRRFLHPDLQITVDEPVVETNLANKYGFKDCYIHPTTEIYRPENITMGPNCWVGGFCHIAGSKAGIKFGHDIAIASRVCIMARGHNYRADTCLPYDNGHICRPVQIEDCVWIGMGAIILGGVKIERGAIVGAGSVVTKSVPKCAIVAGNPAKIIGWRDKKVFERLYKQGKFAEFSKINFDDDYDIMELDFKPFLKSGK